MALIYTVAYLFSLSGLLLWFFIRGNRDQSRMMSKLFLGGFVVYLFALAFSPALLPYKLLILFRDFTILAVVALLFDRIRKNKILYVGFVILLAVVVKLVYLSVLMKTFPGPLSPFSTPAADKYELLIRVEDEKALVSLEPVVDEYQLDLLPAFQPASGEITTLDEYYAVGIPDPQEDKLRRIARTIKRIRGISDVELNDAITSELPVPEDGISRRSPIAGINDPLLADQWGLLLMDPAKVHDLLSAHKPEKQALVAVLDSGIDGGHEDLVSHYRSTRDKYDLDRHGHGTLCAGIIAAVSNNQKGIASLLPGSDHIRVTSIKVMSDRGIGTQKETIRGMIEAADLGADVISLSLGGRSSDKRQAAYEEAVEYCRQKGAVVVVAAGNSGEDAIHTAPANAGGVIAVSAINPDMSLTSFSNRVNNLEMGCSAPGIDITSTLPKNRYGAFNGTSFSAPMVSGLATLMKAYRPELDAEGIYDILDRTGMETKSGRSSGKLIQPVEALRYILSDSGIQ